MAIKVRQKRQSKPSGIGVSLISQVFLENSHFLKKFLGRFLSERQDIEDVVQETYLRAYKAEKHGDESSKTIEYPKAFLFQIAKNIALTELSKKSRRITDYIEDVELSLVMDNGATTEEELEAREHIDIICEAVTSMPERRQRIYLMRKVHGASHKEIADSFGISIRAVEKHLLKAMLTCRDYIREREEIMQNGSDVFNSDAASLLKADVTPREGLTKKNVEL